MLKFSDAKNPDNVHDINKKWADNLISMFMSNDYEDVELAATILNNTDLSKWNNYSWVMYIVRRLFELDSSLDFIFDTNDTRTMESYVYGRGDKFIRLWNGHNILGIRKSFRSWGGGPPRAKKAAR
jgi:hypothetical protein